MKRLLIILPILSLLVASCYKDPYAEAIISPNPAWVGEDITFTNISSNADYAEWDMGDGTSSSAFNVVHSYDESGTYNVTLRAFGRKSRVDVTSFTVEVLIREPFANAMITPNPAWVGEDVTFTNISQYTDYATWSFGDGTTSSAFDAFHYYYDPGAYNVTLTAFGMESSVNVASFVVEVVGSELKVIVEERWDKYLIEGVSVLLFNSYEAWLDLDFSNATEEQFTDRYGECWFSDLSYQRYYVDVYDRVGNEGYSNELLGLEDPVRWIETQQLPGGWDHTFIAVVEAVFFNDTKKSSGRPTHRQPQQLNRKIESSAKNEIPRENKISVKKERK